MENNSKFILRAIELSKKSIKNQDLLKCQIGLMKVIMPFMPHLSCECLSKLEGNDFYSDKWITAYVNSDFSLTEKESYNVFLQWILKGKLDSVS